jgi:TPR repeat protein
MKGQGAYSLAQEINEKLNEYPSVLSEGEKNEFYEKYFALIKKSAYLGYPEGQYDFAQQFENMSFLGIKNPKYDPKKCVFWYSKACKNDHAEACNNLANFYEKGEGCEKNLNFALELYKRSADLGSPNGKKNYKMMVRDLSKGGKYNR